MRLLKPETPDNLLYETWFSEYRFPVLCVAYEVGLFECLKETPLSIDQVAQKCQLTPRAIEVLVRVLFCLGFLSLEEDRLSLTNESKCYLLEESPYSWGALLVSKSDHPVTQRLLSAVQGHKAFIAHEGKSFSDMWASGELTQAAADSFTAKMHATIFPSAVATVKSGLMHSTQALLDIGGGSACFSAAFVSEYPDRKAASFDLAPVNQSAKAYLKQLGCEGQIMLLSGNFFQDPWPSGYDGILLSNILHDWSYELGEQLIENAYQALEKEGKLYIHEMLIEPNADNLSATCFDLLMFMNHHSQQYTYENLFEILKSKGFSNIHRERPFGFYSVVSAVKAPRLGR